MNTMITAILLPQTHPALATLTDIVDDIIPITALVMPFLFVIGVLAIIYVRNYKNRKLQHETLRLLIEKGQPIPEALLSKDEKCQGTNRDRKNGLICLAMGIAIYVFFANLHTGTPEGLRWIGLIPGLIGLALLANWKLDRMESKRSEKSDIH